jgi:hypothetical protein
MSPDDIKRAGEYLDSCKEKLQQGTPRTDALVHERRCAERKSDVWDVEDVEAFVKHARQLERELASMTAARDYCMRTMNEAIEENTALRLRAAGGAAKVPEGWKLIGPRRTPEMLEAGLVQYGQSCSTAGIHVRRIFDAMLAAAPSPDRSNSES